MLKISSWAGIIYFYFVCFYIYLVIANLYLIVHYTDMLKIDYTIYLGVKIACFVDVIMTIIFLIKFGLIIIYRYEKELESQIISNIQGLEFFSVIPHFANFFFLLSQIFYYQGDNFKPENRSILESKLAIQTYFHLRKICALSFIMWFMGMFIIFSMFIFCISCNFCRCLSLPRLFKERKIYYSNRIGVI